MSEQTKEAAAKEGQERLMAFAVGINRRCKKDKIGYDQLAKASGVRSEMLAPALVDVLVKASEGTDEPEVAASPLGDAMDRIK